MRTTLDIDPLILSAAKDVAATSRVSLGVIISTWARQGLEVSHSHISTQKRNGFPVFEVPRGTAPVSSETVKQLLDNEDLPA